MGSIVSNALSRIDPEREKKNIPAYDKLVTRQHLLLQKLQSSDYNIYDKCQLEEFRNLNWELNTINSLKKFLKDGMLNKGVPWPNGKEDVSVLVDDLFGNGMVYIKKSQLDFYKRSVAEFKKYMIKNIGVIQNDSHDTYNIPDASSFFNDIEGAVDFPGKSIIIPVEQVRKIINVSFYERVKELEEKLNDLISKEVSAIESVDRECATKKYNTSLKKYLEQSFFGRLLLKLKIKKSTSRSHRGK